MKKSLKIVSLVLAAIFLIAGTMMIAYAEGEDLPVQEDPGQVDPVTPDPVTPDPVTPDPVTPDPITPDPVTPDPITTDPNQNTGGDNSGYSDGNSGYSDNSNQQVYYDPEPMFYGNSSNNQYEVSDETAGKVSANNNLYNSSGISAAEAAPNEWSEITLDEKTAKTGVADFSSIKTNTETTDNGEWILYLGYILLGLAVLGILYFIIATAAQRKADQAAVIREQRAGSGPSHSAAARMNEREREAQRSISRYNEEIKAYNRRVSSKADTGEIYVPRRAKSK